MPLATRDFSTACCTCAVTLTSWVRRVVFTFSVWIGTRHQVVVTAVKTTALYNDAQDFCCRTVFAIQSIPPGPSVPEMAKDKAPSIAGPCAGTATAPENSHAPQGEWPWRPARGQFCAAAYRS